MKVTCPRGHQVDVATPLFEDTELEVVPTADGQLTREVRRSLSEMVVKCNHPDPHSESGMCGVLFPVNLTGVL